MDKNLNVLYITNIPSPYSVDLFREIGKSCDLTVIYERINAADRDEKWIVNNKTNKNFKEFFLNGIPIGTDGSLSFRIIKYLKDKQYDLIVIGTYYTLTGMLAIEWLRHNKKPFILKIDGGFPKKDSRIKYLIKHHFISSASAWLSSGEITNQYLIRYGAEKDDIYYYPFTSVKKNDILCKQISKQEKLKIRKNLNIKEDKVVISVGQFIDRKGHDILLKAFYGMTSNIGLYIIGGKPTDKYLELKNTLALGNAHFIDFKAQDELRDYYKAADIFVLATREDIWGLVINEAMAFGLPVISTKKCIAATELIMPGENGYIVEVEDSNELQRKMNKILHDEELQSYMAQNSLEIIQPYNIENMATCIYRTLQSIVDNSN